MKTGMLEEEAWVIEVEGDYAQVRALGQASCQGCAAGNACGTALLGKWFLREGPHLWAQNALQARVGDRVVIGIDEQAIRKASIRVYLLPLLGLLVGAALGVWFSTGSPYRDLLSIVLGMVGLGLPLYVLSRGKGRFDERRLGVRIIRILPPAQAGLAVRGQIH